MSQKTYTLDNHRQLKGSEVIRKGDFYRTTASGEIKPVRHSIGHKPDTFTGARFTFFRRLHTKKGAKQSTPQPRSRTGVVKPVTKPTTARRFPEVTFSYHSTRRWGAPETRRVKVISMDAKYIVGLEVTEGGSHHQFKRFCVDKVRGDVKLVSY